ncbi:hypothetical protein AXF42_Ash006359 [Apostasia shenzhenica]|uniref:Uncharacterized protein n=1 Tax=Apostasia shenzhenica TaxID=1088818 RepID=A0A2I0AYW6_9ASPA|nr:hypothetical protein AXF42_Ash006359 [Apostasia shenzhenica]
MITNKRKIFDDRLSVRRIMLFEKKDCDMSVDIDDYPCPIEKEEAKAAPLSYVGRELLMEDERICLDAFCGQPMHKDDVVFFNWNVTIGRQSMVNCLQGRGTREEV